MKRLFHIFVLLRMSKHVLFDHEEVLRNSLNVFWEKGFHGTSMQDLVDITGLNRSSIYNSFGDKFNLYLKTLQFYRKQQARLTQKILLQNGTALAILKHLFMSGLMQKKTPRDNNGCFIVNCTTELSESQGPIKSIISDNKDNMLVLLADLIKQAQKEGDISTQKDPQALAFFLFSSLQGLRLTSLIEDDSKKLTALVNDIINTL